MSTPGAQYYLGTLDNGRDLTPKRGTRYMLNLETGETAELGDVINGLTLCKRRYGGPLIWEDRRGMWPI
jgi:hypothetical protein